MPTRKITKVDTELIVRGALPTAKEMVRKTNLKIGTGADASKLLEPFKVGRPVVIAGFPKDKKVPYLFLSPGKPYVEGKGEMRFFKPDFVHTSAGYADFSLFDSGLLIWIHGLETGADYAAKLRVRSFVADFFNPKASDSAMFKITAGVNEFSFKPNFKEQTIPISFLEVGGPLAMLYVRIEGSMNWTFFDLTVVKAEL